MAQIIYQIYKNFFPEKFFAELFYKKATRSPASHTPPPFPSASPHHFYRYLGVEAEMAVEMMNAIAILAVSTAMHARKVDHKAAKNPVSVVNESHAEPRI